MSGDTKNKQMNMQISGFKSVPDTMKFTCYGNVKGNIDHAQDRTMDGAYMDSIKTHNTNGTMPKMLWMHNPYETPVGKWLKMDEDSHGLFLEGEFANTEKGRELYELMKMGALDSFSIGYKVVEEKWNQSKGCNDLHKLDIREISIVNMACNEESTLQSIKSSIEDDDAELTDRMIQDMLRKEGISKRTAEKLVNQYKASSIPTEIEVTDITSFRQKMDTSETKVYIEATEGEIKTKEMGALSFDQIENAICDRLVTNIGHRDFWVCKIFDGYGFVEYWDYVNRDFKIARFEWAVMEDVVEVSNFQIGDFTFSYEFTAEEIDEEGTEEIEEEGEKDSLEELFSKEDMSAWFTK